MLSVPWARGYKMATTQPDVGLFVAVRTPEREQLFHWVGPIVSTSASLYARSGEASPVTSLEEARQLGRIAVPRDGIHIRSWCAWASAIWRWCPSPTRCVNPVRCSVEVAPC